MTKNNKIILGLLAVLIVLSASAANAAIATDRTVLSGESISDTFQEEDVYAELISEAEGAIEDDVEAEADTGDGPDGVAVEAEGVLGNVITEEYLGEQVERNIDLFLLFLSGESEELQLWLDIEPIKDEITISGDQIDVDTGQLVAGADLESDDFGVSVTGEMVTRMNADADGYADVRQEIRDDLRDAGVPEWQVDDALRVINRDLKQQSAAQTRDQLGDDVSEQTVQATIELQHVVIDGLTDPALDDFEQYSQQREGAETDLENALAAEINQEIQSELDDEIHFEGDIRDELDEDELSTAETVLGGINTSTWLMPLLVVVFAGGIFYVTKSYKDTATKAGAALAVAGVIGLVAGVVGGSMATSSLENQLSPDGDGEANVIFDGVIAVFESLFSTLTMQSVYLTVFGVGLVGLVYADNEGHLDGLKESLGSDGEGNGQGRQPQQGQQQPQQGQQQQPQQGQQQHPHGEQRQQSPPEDQHRGGQQPNEPGESDEQPK